jgi:hypothetical protein
MKFKIIQFIGAPTVRGTTFGKVKVSMTIITVPAVRQLVERQYAE